MTLELYVVGPQALPILALFKFVELSSIDRSAHLGRRLGSLQALTEKMR